MEGLIPQVDPLQEHVLVPQDLADQYRDLKERDRDQLLVRLDLLHQGVGRSQDLQVLQEAAAFLEEEDRQDHLDLEVAVVAAGVEEDSNNRITK